MLARLGAQVGQDAPLQRGVDLLPQGVAPLIVQALDQSGDLGRVQARHELAHALVATRVQRFDDALAVGHRTRRRMWSVAGIDMVIVVVVVFVVVHSSHKGQTHSSRGTLMATTITSTARPRRQ